MYNLKLFLFNVLIILFLGCSSEQAKESSNAQEEVFDFKGFTGEF